MTKTPEILYKLEDYPSYAVTACGNVYAYKRKKILAPIILGNKIYYSLPPFKRQVSSEELGIEMNRDTFIAYMRKTKRWGLKYSRENFGKGYVCIYDRLGEMQSSEYFTDRKRRKLLIERAVNSIKNLKNYYVQIEPIYE